MPIPWGPIAAVGGSILGWSGQKSAQSAANARHNEMIEKQYQYNTQLYEMQKEKSQADWDEVVRNIQKKQEDELKLAAYKDANALDSYNYGMQIRNMKQDSLNRQFLKSQRLHKQQRAFNTVGATLAKRSQQRALREATQRLIFQNQDAILKQMAAKGEAIVKGGSGRTAGKVVQSTIADLGRTQSALAESLMSAQTNTRAANLNIDLKKAIADKNADANLMLDPGTLPVPPVPYKTLVTEYDLPRELEDFDFGPEPIKGAQMTYTGSWANLGAGILNSLASASPGPAQNNAVGAFGVSDFINPGTSYDFSGGGSLWTGGDWTNSIGDYSSLSSSLSLDFSSGGSGMYGLP